MAVICFFFTPFPDIMGKVFADRVSNSMEVDKQTSAWEHFGSFLSAFFGTCGFGIIVVLAHTRVVRVFFFRPSNLHFFLDYMAIPCL